MLQVNEVTGDYNPHALSLRMQGIVNNILMNNLFKSFMKLVIS